MINNAIMKPMLDNNDGRPPPVFRNAEKRFWGLGKVFETLKNVFEVFEKFAKRRKTFLGSWKSFRNVEKRFWGLGKVFGTLKNVFGGFEKFSEH